MHECNTTTLNYDLSKIYNNEVQTLSYDPSKIYTNEVQFSFNVAWIETSFDNFNNISMSWSISRLLN